MSPRALLFLLLQPPGVTGVRLHLTLYVGVGARDGTSVLVRARPAFYRGLILPVRPLSVEVSLFSFSVRIYLYILDSSLYTCLQILSPSLCHVFWFY